MENEEVCIDIELFGKDLHWSLVKKRWKYFTDKYRGLLLKIGRQFKLVDTSKTKMEEHMTGTKVIQKEGGNTSLEEMITDPGIILIKYILGNFCNIFDNIAEGKWMNEGDKVIQDFYSNLKWASANKKWYDVYLYYVPVMDFAILCAREQGKMNLILMYNSEKYDLFCNYRLARFEKKTTRFHTRCFIGRFYQKIICHKTLFLPPNLPKKVEESLRRLSIENRNNTNVTVPVNISKKKIERPMSFGSELKAEMDKATTGKYTNNEFMEERRRMEEKELGLFNEELVRKAKQSLKDFNERLEREKENVARRNVDLEELKKHWADMEEAMRKSRKEFEESSLNNDSAKEFEEKLRRQQEEFEKEIEKMRRKREENMEKRDKEMREMMEEMRQQVYMFVACIQLKNYWEEQQDIWEDYLKMLRSFITRTIVEYNNLTYQYRNIKQDDFEYQFYIADLYHFDATMRNTYSILYDNFESLGKLSNDHPDKLFIQVIQKRVGQVANKLVDYIDMLELIKEDPSQFADIQDNIFDMRQFDIPTTSELKKECQSTDPKEPMVIDGIRVLRNCDISEIHPVEPLSASPTLMFYS